MGRDDFVIQNEFSYIQLLKLLFMILLVQTLLEENLVIKGMISFWSPVFLFF